MSRRCWVFDLDGTLTVAQHDFAAIKRELGLPLHRPVLEGIADRPAAERPVLLQAVHDWEVGIAGSARANPGAEALLSALTAAGRPIGVLTRNSRETALVTLAAAGLGRFFTEGVVLGRDEAAPKPAPDGVLRLLDGWGAPASSGVMVGDYRFDLEAARAAGVRAVWLDVDRTGEFAALADRVVHSLEELLSPFE